MEKENLLIVHVSINFAGGVGTVIKNLINHQLKCGYKVCIAYVNVLGQSVSEFLFGLIGEVTLYPVDRANFKGSNILFGVPLKQLYLKVKKENPEFKIVLHAHNPAAIGMINDISEIPIVCTIHGINQNNSFISKRITKYVIKKMKKNNKCIVAVSDDTARYYNEEINSQIIKTVRNGVDITKNPVKYQNRNFTIGFTSYIDDLKGWKCIFDAYLLLLPEYKGKINLVFAGDGPKSEIELLKSLIIKHGLSESVKFLGYVPNSGNVLMPSFDIFVLPSKSEGIPMTILEALGHGVPVLATAVGGIPEVIESGYNGFLIKRDPKLYAEKFKLIVEDPFLNKKLKENAYVSYSSNFTGNIMGEKYEGIYREI
jgi:L-malate glycosyltransferase